MDSIPLVAHFRVLEQLRKLICWHFNVIAKSIEKSNCLLNAYRQKGSKLSNSISSHGLKDNVAKKKINGTHFVGSRAKKQKEKKTRQKYCLKSVP